jgi:hypothetical protein
VTTPQRSIKVRRETADKDRQVQPDQLVAELLTRGDMNDDTTKDLNRILEDWRAGKLDPDDEAYLRAFHSRLMNLAPEPEDVVATGPARLDGLTIEEWRERALKAEADLSRIEDAARNG